VLGEGSCGVVESARIARWMAEQSAGQCGPCVNGLPAIAHALEALAGGAKEARLTKRLATWLSMVDGRGACHHPDGAVRFVRSALDLFAKEIEHHRRYGPCSASSPRLSMGTTDGSWR